MKLTINNKEHETNANTLAELALEMNLPEKGVAIAVNNQMVPRAEWSATDLIPSSKILIIKAFCGG